MICAPRTDAKGPLVRGPLKRSNYKVAIVKAVAMPSERVV